ncbi:homeobox protein extradenticle isoform X1 [Vespula squamosa]|uniref:Homeobox protein extradenticle isoform X1 n=1 Tax=Vespula squamosa TaxID=30214 RepID=A0ABD2B2K3_VESSQ
MATLCAWDKDRGLKSIEKSQKMTQGKALAGGPGATGWMQQREAVPEFPPLHDSADSDSDRENEKRPRV